MAVHLYWVAIIYLFDLFYLTPEDRWKTDIESYKMPS